MNILWLATKAPWPARDGGRLLLHTTLAAMAARGHRITLVAPVEPGDDLPATAAALEPVCTAHLLALRPRRLLAAWLDGQLRGLPLSVARHRRPPLARLAARLAGARAPAVAEQVQAWQQLPAGVPRVLRAQNVESDLWRAVADAPSLPWPALRRPLLHREARRLARYEGRAVGAAAGALALTDEDAARLGALAGGADVEAVPAPFAATLPAADAPLAGAPAVVLLGSGGWLPNREGARWFLDAVWPRLYAARPAARLHVFGLEAAGGPGAGVVGHPPPADSRQAFAPGAHLAVPLFVASGVRMKILEAWARGVPVVATSAAARGLAAADGRELLLADTPAEFAAALGRLAADPALGRSLTAAGRDLLRRRHDPAAVAAALERRYASLATGSGVGASMNEA